MEKTKIILDCDPGHDDAVAMIMAARHPALELLGITIVAGNQTLEKTTRNALNVLQHLKAAVPVYPGCRGPMVREKPIRSDEIHGQSGLDGPVFAPLHLKAQQEHAVNYLIRTLLASESDITLVPTGPLTNIAMAMRLEPAISGRIRQIVLMGGALGLGNVTPAAEFNIMADAEAAHVVFSSGCPIVMMGLDLTRQALCTPEVIARMEGIGNKASDLFAELMRFTGNTQKTLFGLEGSPLHDPTCIAYLLDPDCIRTRDMFVAVELRSEGCYGRTLCDYYGVSGERPNAKVGLRLDEARFWQLMEDCLRLYSY